jgi:hypothetical protein
MSTTRPTVEDVKQLAKNFSAVKPILDQYRYVLAMKRSAAVKGCVDAELMELAVASAKALYDTAAASVNAALRTYFGVELLDAVRVTMTNSSYARNFIVEDLRLTSGRYGMSFYGRVVRVNGTVGVKTEEMVIWHPDNGSISRIENLKMRPLEAPL